MSSRTDGAAPAQVRDLLEQARDVATQQGTHTMARRMERALEEFEG